MIMEDLIRTSGSHGDAGACHNNNFLLLSENFKQGVEFSLMGFDFDGIRKYRAAEVKSFWGFPRWGLSG